MDLRSRKRRLTDAGLQRRVVAFLWSNQVDAAARVGEDEICDGGGGRARATEKQQEEEDDWKEENGKT